MTPVENEMGDTELLRHKQMDELRRMAEYVAQLQLDALDALSDWAKREADGIRASKTATVSTGVLRAHWCEGRCSPNGVLQGLQSAARAPKGSR